MIKKAILHGSEVEYTVRRSARARNVRVAVYCDASVIVTVPTYFWGEFRIERFLIAKAEWILDKINYFKKFGKIRHVRPKYRFCKRHCEQARKLVLEKINKINQLYNFSYNKIFIRNQKTRWGSCSRMKNLNFNYKIIFLPEHLSEYIVAHELCHLQEFNHSRNFWNLLSQSVPDYKLRIKELKKIGL